MLLKIVRRPSHKRRPCGNLLVEPLTTTNTHAARETPASVLYRPVHPAGRPRLDGGEAGQGSRRVGEDDLAVGDQAAARAREAGGGGRPHGLRTGGDRFAPLRPAPGPGAARRAPLARGPLGRPSTAYPGSGGPRGSGADGADRAPPGQAGARLARPQGPAQGPTALGAAQGRRRRRAAAAGGEVPRAPDLGARRAVGPQERRSRVGPRRPGPGAGGAVLPGGRAGAGQ